MNEKHAKTILWLFGFIGISALIHLVLIAYSLWTDQMTKVTVEILIWTLIFIGVCIFIQLVIGTYSFLRKSHLE